MDGVLFDSMRNHTESWYTAITELNIPCTIEEFYLHEGRTGASTIDLLFERTFGKPADEDRKQAIYLRKTEIFNSLPPARVMPGALETLQTVRSLGIRPVLVTGSGQKSLLGKLEVAFPGFFRPENMVTAFDVSHGKPHPEPYLKGLAKAGVRAHEAIVVENAPMGVEAGVAAGVFTIAVNTGIMDDSELLSRGADYLLPSMTALANEIEHICRKTI